MSARNTQLAIACSCAMFLVSFSGLVNAAEDDAPKALEFLPSATTSTAGAPIQLLLVRRGPGADQGIVVYGPAGSRVWRSDESRVCAQAPDASSTLQIPASGPDVVALCFSMEQAGSAARLAAVSVTGADVLTAVSDSLEFREAASTSIWSTPFMTVALPAVIGFVFGLGSSFFQVWLERWKESRLARAQAEQFVASTLFPELSEHATKLNAFFVATDEDKRKLATQALAVPNVTSALKDPQYSALTQYFDSFSRRSFARELRAYEGTLSRYNHEANVLIRQPSEQRQVAQQEQHASALRSQLQRWGLYR